MQQSIPRSVLLSEAISSLEEPPDRDLARCPAGRQDDAGVIRRSGMGPGNLLCLIWMWMKVAAVHEALPQTPETLLRKSEDVVVNKV